MATEFKRMKQLFDSTAGWAANNIVMLAGEIGIEDTGTEIKGKIGNGSDTWAALPYSMGKIASSTAVAEAARFDGAGLVTYETTSGWSAVRESLGVYRVTFPAAAVSADAQSVSACILATSNAPTETHAVWIRELTVSDCKVTIAGATTGTSNTRLDSGFSIQRFVG